MKSMRSFFRLLFLLVATAAQLGCDGDDSTVAQTWFIPERSALTVSQTSSFDTQGLYYNVHSPAHPGGEIRGQIVPASTALVTDTGNPVTSNNFSTTLSGAEEVPANASSATGYSTIALDPATRVLRGAVVTSGIAGSAAHIHDGIAGENGPIVVPLAGGPVVWTVPAGTTLTDAQVARLTGGAYYVNVHTTAFPNGEIRGQLNRQVRFALLSGANEVPPVATAASGTAVLSLDPATNQIGGIVMSTGVSGTAAHIHEAATGVNGPVIVPLTETPAGSGIWVVPAGQMLTAGQAVSFNAGNLYYNVHSLANPGGEIRGQILPATLKTGNATLQGAQEVPPVGTFARGTGIISVNSVTREVSGTIQTTDVPGTAAHVHEGATGSNGPVIVPLTLTPPASTP